MNNDLAGGLSAPKTLFDSSEVHLTTLLPRDSFPADIFCDPPVLHALRALGLCATLTCEFLSTYR